MLIDGDLFEDDKEFLQYMKTVHEYGAKNLALLKVGTLKFIFFYKS